MKKMKALQIIAAAMAVTVAATSAPVNVFAYGETSASSTLFTDTQNISDYATWKDNVWNKKDDQGNLTGEGESYDSSRIILTLVRQQKIWDLHGTARKRASRQ